MTPQVLNKTQLSPKDGGDLMLAIQNETGYTGNVKGAQKHHGGKSAGPGTTKFT